MIIGAASVKMIPKESWWTARWKRHLGPDTALATLIAVVDSITRCLEEQPIQTPFVQTNVARSLEQDGGTFFPFIADTAVRQVHGGSSWMIYC